VAYSISEKCIGCTACARNCPVFAISGGLKKLHVINPRRCVECGVCGRTCPKAAVQDPAGNYCEQLHRTKWRKPVIELKLCSACGICVKDCAPGALKISLPRFRGDIGVHAELASPAKCVACGICERHCPMGAIRMEKPPALKPKEALSEA
jgi:formate hydrogenlyase subunit 6/NADH:ubiquinone oxidoreductase subunit I